jgi:alanine racemase
MAQAELTIDLDAIVANWRALDAASAAHVETGATIKADAYGLGVAPVARALAGAGVRKFFVALAEEGAALRTALGPGPAIHVFSGHMDGDAPLIAGADLIPMLNAPMQLARHLAALPGHAFGIQLDSGMNRLGMEPAEWAACRDQALSGPCRLVMSHLACADEPAHDMNQRQLDSFLAMTDGIALPRSLSATGGTLLGAPWHFDLTRPGIGLYGGEPFLRARPVARLALPIIQVRDVAQGETVGYSNTYTTGSPIRVATVAAGYADGVLRSLSGKGQLWHGDKRCDILGRVSMDLITVDVTDLADIPDSLDLLNTQFGVDALAAQMGTIGYEVLTSLGPRYRRNYVGAG